MNTKDFIFNCHCQTEVEGKPRVPHDVSEARIRLHRHFKTVVIHSVSTSTDIMDQVAACGQQFSVYVYDCDPHIVEVHYLLLHHSMEGLN